MNRLFAFFAALTLTAITVSSSCLASSADNIRFTLHPSKRADLQLQLRSGSSGRDGSMGSSFAAHELAGLDVAAFRSPGSHPIRFALLREAGRVDCAGSGGNSNASGTCTLVADPGFAQFLVSRGVGRAAREEAYHLTMVGASRALVEAIRSARYPTPDIDELTALAAVDVTPAYISELSGSGYKPASLDDLVQFGALDITPAYIDAMSRSGYRNLDADAIVQMKAVGVTPDYVTQLARTGYPNLSADNIVQFRALDVSADFIAGFERLGYRGLSADTLVQLKALDVTPQYVTNLRRAGIALPSADQLVKLRAVGFSPNNRS
ncbi:MAG: hypothetical protein H0T82_01115 [Sphingomonas sp.]|nr:hypothetical protein [Sphingomonas sp.]